VPIAHIAIPRCGYVPTSAVPDPYVFGVPASAGAGIGVEFADADVAERCNRAVVGAGDAGVWIGGMAGVKVEACL